jgi:hypothetical protein
VRDVRARLRVALGIDAEGAEALARETRGVKRLLKGVVVAMGGAGDGCVRLGVSE